jgi:hypothetical protein
VETILKPRKHYLMQRFLEIAWRLRLASVIRVSVDDSRSKKDQGDATSGSDEFQILAGLEGCLAANATGGW